MGQGQGELGESLTIVDSVQMYKYDFSTYSPDGATSDAASAK